MLYEVIFTLLQNLSPANSHSSARMPSLQQFNLPIEINCRYKEFRNEQAHLVNPVVESGAAHLDSLVLLLEVAEVAAQDGVAGVRWGDGGALVVSVSLGRGQQGEGGGG